MGSMKKTMAILACFVMAVMPLVADIQSELFDTDASGDTAVISYEFCPNGTVSKSTGIFTPPTPVQEGYQFLFWKCHGVVYYAGQESDLRKAFTNGDIPDNVEMTAYWSANKYTATFKDGATTVGTMDCTFNMPIGSLPTLNKEGHHLVGWSTSDSVNDVISERTVYSEPQHMTFYAIWDTNTYKISFLDADDNEICDHITCKYESQIGELPVLMKRGHSLGWSYDKEGTDMVTDSSIYDKAGDSVLYAVWTANTYNVTFMCEGKEMGSRTVSYGDCIGEMSVPAMNGKKMVGWSTDGSRENIVPLDTCYDYEGDITLYAVLDEIPMMTSSTGDSTILEGPDLSFDNPTSVAILLLVLVVTAGLCFLVYRKGII